MVAVTAQIVHFLPKLVPVRADLSKELAQSKRLRLQYREFQGQFVRRVPSISLRHPGFPERCSSESG